MLKDIFSGVGKFFKSNFGSTLLKAAAVYVGGAAAGLWDTPFSSINGAFTSGAGAVPADTGSGVAAADEAASANAPTAAEATLDSGVGNATPNASAPTAMPPSTVTAPNAAAPASPGILDSLWSGYKSLSGPAQAALIQTGGAALKGAFTPTQSQLLEKEAKLQRDNMAWRNAFLAPNYNVSNVNVGTPNPTPHPLTDASGSPVYPVVKSGGILNNAMR